MPRARAILLFLLIAGIAAILFLPRRFDTRDVPFTASGVTLHTYSNAGELSWEVRAGGGEVIGDTGTLSDVEVRFVSSNETSLTATAARLSRTERSSTLTGDVRIERDDGLRLETAEMVWDEDEERLRAGPIMLSLRDLTVEGEQFDYDIRAERAEITGGVLATIDRNPPVTVLGDRAEEANDILAVEGDVRVETDDGVYRCDRIEAEDDAVRLVGNVVAGFDEGELRADHAEIDPDGRLTATGRVSLHLNLGSEEEADGS